MDLWSFFFRNANGREKGDNNMAKKVWKRVFRSGKLMPGQIERDRKLRRLIQAEFPPLPRPLIPRSLSASLKKQRIITQHGIILSYNPQKQILKN